MRVHGSLSVWSVCLCVSLCFQQHLLPRIYARVNVYPTFMATASRKTLRRSGTSVPPQHRFDHRFTLDPLGPPTRRTEQMPHLFNDHFKNPCPARLQHELQLRFWSVHHSPHAQVHEQKKRQLDHELQYTRMQFVLHDSCSSAY